MIRLVNETEEARIAHHVANPVRAYATDPMQANRIEVSRNYVRRTMGGLMGRLVEIGCGVGEIGGGSLMSRGMNDGHWTGLGIDCHEPSVIEANLRYNHYGYHAMVARIGRAAGGPPVDTVILCEILEHLNDAVGVASSWLRRSRYSVISHPLEEQVGSQLSAGDHCWSFDEKDHKKFFEVGGHAIEETEIFRQGAYQIIISRGKQI